MDNIKIYSVSPPGMMGDNGREMPHNSGMEMHRDMPIGMAYVPNQVWRDIYENGKGLMRGTIFAELDKPFKGANKR